MLKFPFYYGWVVLSALAVTEMMAFGTTAYAAGLFVLPLQSEFGLSRAAANLSFSVLLAGVMILAPLVGKALDRYSVKWVLISGAAAISLAFVVIAWSTSLWLMVLMLILPAAIGFSVIGTLTTGTLLSRWFYNRRGLALGIGAVATSGGGIFIAPQLSSLIQSYGWRTTLLLEASVILLVTILLAVFVVCDRPSDMGLETHAENKGRPDSDLMVLAGQPRWHWHEILRNRTFWGTAIMLAVITGISQALVTTMPPYAQQLGFDAPAAAQLIGYFAFAAGFTKILGGLLADYTNRRLLLFCSGLIMAVAAGVLLASSSYAALVAASVLAGTALGCVLPSSAAIIALVFGAPSFGTVMGWVYVLFALSTIVLPPLAGAIFDRTDSYNAAFIFFMILPCLAAMCTLMIPRQSQ